MHEYYSIKDYLPRPIVVKISREENQIRQMLMQQIISRNAPVKIPDAVAESMARTLCDKNVIALDSNNQLTAVYPVSALPTDKKVFLEDGRQAWAMCAIDALGFHYAFNQPVRILSKCEYCGHVIELLMQDGKVEVVQGGTDIYVLHTDLESHQDWSCSCCNIMHFFNCRESLRAWVQAHEHNKQKKFAVSLETANKIAWLLFSE